VHYLGNAADVRSSHPLSLLNPCLPAGLSIGRQAGVDSSDEIFGSSPI